MNTGVSLHKTAKHLFSILRGPGICKTDERAIHSYPRRPFKLKQKLA